MSEHRLFYVDDDPDEIFIFRHSCRKAGVVLDVQHVSPSGDARSTAVRLGVQLARSPGLVLLDLNMPGCPGHEVLRQLRCYGNGLSWPVIIYTTSRNPADVGISYRLGANAHVRKPENLNGHLDLVRALDAFWFGCVDLPGMESPST